MEKINLDEKFCLISDFWCPKIIAEVNDSRVKLVKLMGKFFWHRHEFEDEMFVVIRGRLTIKFRESEARLTVGECIVIPKGVEHLTVAEEEVHVMLIEPKSTINTGDVENDQTKKDLDWI